MSGEVQKAIRKSFLNGRTMEVQSLPHVEPENVFPATAKKSLERIPFRNGFEPLEKLYFPDGSVKTVGIFPPKPLGLIVILFRTSML